MEDGHIPTWYNSIAIPNQLTVLTPLPRAKACTEIILVYSGEKLQIILPHMLRIGQLSHAG